MHFLSKILNPCSYKSKDVRKVHLSRSHPVIILPGDHEDLTANSLYNEQSDIPSNIHSVVIVNEDAEIDEELKRTDEEESHEDGINPFQVLSMSFYERKTSNVTIDQSRGTIHSSFQHFRPNMRLEISPPERKVLIAGNDLLVKTKATISPANNGKDQYEEVREKLTMSKLKRMFFSPQGRVGMGARKDSEALEKRQRSGLEKVRSKREANNESKSKSKTKESFMKKNEDKTKGGISVIKKNQEESVSYRSNERSCVADIKPKLTLKQSLVPGILKEKKDNIMTNREEDKLTERVQAKRPAVKALKLKEILLHSSRQKENKNVLNGSGRVEKGSSRTEKGSLLSILDSKKTSFTNSVVHIKKEASRKLSKEKEKEKKQEDRRDSGPNSVRLQPKVKIPLQKFYIDLSGDSKNSPLNSLSQLGNLTSKVQSVRGEKEEGRRVSFGNEDTIKEEEELVQRIQSSKVIRPLEERVGDKRNIIGMSQTSRLGEETKKGKENCSSLFLELKSSMLKQALYSPRENGQNSGSTQSNKGLGWQNYFRRTSHNSTLEGSDIRNKETPNWMTLDQNEEFAGIKNIDNRRLSSKENSTTFRLG